MNKSFKAFLLGYIIFNVNGRRFWLYNSALNYKISIDIRKTVDFSGFNIWCGRRGFYCWTGG